MLARRAGLGRLLNPRTIAVIGGGAWCRSVIEQARRFNPDAKIYPVHPSADEIGGLRVYTSVKHLPEPPDATFIGINRDATIGVVEQLRELGAGGAVCFASGFSEMKGEDQDADAAQRRLVAAAGDMPVLGPNCYGLINALDGTALWPDQHGCVRVESGVAILTQSSNIAINLTMQKRGLPIAFVITCGNQAQTSQAMLAMAMLDDPRVTAIGLHIEGFGDVRAWEALARAAHEKGILLVALKVGKSEQARAATISHTASLAGHDAGANAFMERLGICRVPDLPSFLETLKLLHVLGRPKSNRIAAISCSGGEASLIADMATETTLEFPALNETQQSGLRAALGPKVTLANPLDYHTFIWRDEDRMTTAWSAMGDPDVALTLLIIDYPRSDACDPTDWTCATRSALRCAAEHGMPVAIVATLPELMPEEVCAELMAGGVVPFNGLREALCAIETTFVANTLEIEPVLTGSMEGEPRLILEHDAKARMRSLGLAVPDGVSCADPAEIPEKAAALAFPVAVKALGLAHKSEAGGVILDCPTIEAAQDAARGMPQSGGFLIEEMIPKGHELRVGILNDPPHGFLLTLGAGGVMTELLSDQAHLLIPASREAVRSALNDLRIGRLLQGYRGGDAADMEAILDTIEKLQDYVLANANRLSELEINPLICTPTGAFVTDALIREVP
ncbi:MAG: acetate--CoA ligase family protein [Paracoccaceae bacterium]